MVDLVISKDELIKLFNSEDIKDSNDGWIYMQTTRVNIIALHEKDPKYIYDVTNAQKYKIVAIQKNKG